MTTYTHITVPTGLTPDVAGPRLLMVPHRSKAEALSYAYRRGLRGEPTTFYQLTSPVVEKDVFSLSLAEVRAALQDRIPDLGPSSLLATGLGRPFLVAKAEEELMEQIRKREGATTLDLSLVAHAAHALSGQQQEVSHG